MVGLGSTAAVALLVTSVAARSYEFNSDGKTLAVPFHRKEHTQSSPQGAHRARLAKRQGKTSGQTISWGDLLYYINITLGTPPQSAAAWLDTGSSDLWVPDTGSDICETSQAGCSGNGGFNPSKSSTYKTVEADGFAISYASGDKIIGDFGTDVLKMDNVQLKNMQFGVASRGKSSSPLSGIMGIGYTLGESVTQESDLYPNIIDQLVAQGVISSKTYSLYLNDLDEGHGTILFGGVDKAKYSGTLGIVDVQPTAETGNFDTFSVVLSSLTFVANGKKNNLDLGGGMTVVLDSGTTLTYLPDQLALAVYDGLGIMFDENNGPYVLCNVETANMFFAFTFGAEDGVTINVDLSQFVRPYDKLMELPTVNGAKTCAFGLYPAGSVTQGQGDILFGDTFLRSAYVVYDISNNQIAMAQAKFSADKTDIVAINGNARASTNTIPGATTVANQASGAGAEATDIGAAPTQDGFGSAATADSGNPSATFNGLPNGGLQTGNTAPPGSGTSTNAAPVSRIPPFDWAALAVLGTAGAATLMGSGLFFLL